MNHNQLRIFEIHFLIDNVLLRMIIFFIYKVVLKFQTIYVAQASILLAHFLPRLFVSGPTINSNTVVRYMEKFKGPHHLHVKQYK